MAEQVIAIAEMRSLSFDASIPTYLESDLPASAWFWLHGHGGTAMYVACRGSTIANGSLIATRRTGTGIRMQMSIYSTSFLKPQFFLEDQYGTALLNFDTGSGVIFQGDSKVVSVRLDNSASPQIEHQRDTFAAHTTNLAGWKDGGDPEGTLRVGATPDPFLNSLTGQIGEIVLYDQKPDDVTHAALRAEMEAKFSEDA